jgi:ubiquinone/menaquinone biosynthesis C-methylase UbiE
VLEIAESTYSKKFGTGNINYQVLHYNHDNPNATIIADLSKPSSLPENKIDCFICTQTFQFIYNFKEAIEGAHRLLKRDGVLLATMAGISQISRYDMDRWGDYWRFTKLSALKSFEEVFGAQNVEVEAFGNVLSSIAFLEGITVEELSQEEIDHRDDNYQMLIAVIARKTR